MRVKVLLFFLCKCSKATTKFRIANNLTFPSNFRLIFSSTKSDSQIDAAAPRLLIDICILVRYVPDIRDIPNHSYFH